MVRWKGAFQLGMFILGLFCVDVNVVGGNRGKVERGFSTWDVYFGIVLLFVLMYMMLVEIVVRWERGFSTWDVYVGIVWC